MKLRRLVNEKYDGDIKRAAKACGVSEQQIRNWLSQKRDVFELVDGRWVLWSGRTVVFK